MQYYCRGSVRGWWLHVVLRGRSGDLRWEDDVTVNCRENFVVIKSENAITLAVGVITKENAFVCEFGKSRFCWYTGLIWA
jgi:hypothetical protein